MGTRGDVIVLGGLGNITSYDFGGSPIQENGGLHPDKYHWIRGFFRFAREFSEIILNSDGKAYVELVAGGGNVALLTENGVQPDHRVDRYYENFNVYRRQ